MLVSVGDKNAIVGLKNQCYWSREMSATTKRAAIYLNDGTTIWIFPKKEIRKVPGDLSLMTCSDHPKHRKNR